MNLLTIPVYMYEPQEDSELLAACVRKHAFGKVLDMCTGSGIQARAAQATQSVTSVLAADIDPSVLPIEGIDSQQSDLFSSITGTYDTIICNPPYLPNDPDDDDIALYGGSEGWEFTKRFLEEAKAHIAAQGQILLLFSSLTNKDKVLAVATSLGYEAEQLARKRYFFEELYVYRLHVRER